jgi:uncharacterized membrane protein
MLRVGPSAWLACLVATAWSCGGDDGNRGPSTSSGVGGSASADFCDALAVLEVKCQRCHQDPPVNNAPFALLSYADTQVERSSGDRVYEDMLDAVETGVMPPTAGAYTPPVEPLTCSEKATLLDWLKAGAPRPAGNDPSCEDVEPILLECPR